MRTASLRRFVTVLAVFAMVFASSVVVLTPFTGIPLLSVHAAGAADKIVHQGGGSGSMGCGTNCKQGTATCDTATGQGLYNGHVTWEAPYPPCLEPGVPGIIGSDRTCVTQTLVWDFYGSGNVEGPSDVVNSYTVSEIHYPSYCTGASQKITAYAPVPTDAPAPINNAGTYIGRPGDAWCQGGHSYPQSLHGAPVPACLGYSPLTFTQFHYAPNGLLTTMPNTTAVVQNAGQSCATLGTGSALVQSLLNNTSLVTNPFGTNPAQVTIATAVREALIGNTSQLNGKKSSYGYWQSLGYNTAKMAAAVVDDTTATQSGRTTPSLGVLSTLHFGDGVACSSDLNYVSPTLAKMKNFGTCSIPVMRLQHAFSTPAGTAWTPDTWAAAGPGTNPIWTYAGARFMYQRGNVGQTPAPNWRRIIFNDVLNNRIGTGNSGAGPGEAHGFPFQPYLNNSTYATQYDMLAAALAAKNGANCYFGSGGSVIKSKVTSTGTFTGGTTTPGKTTPGRTVTVKTKRGTIPPRDAIVEVTLSPNPIYGVDGGTLHTNTFRAVATGLLCPAAGGYADCNSLYPGLYRLNSLNWKITLTPNSAAYQRCAYQTASNCQFYIAQNNNVGPMSVYFYSATQPGQMLKLDVGDISGSYTVYPALTTETHTATTLGTTTAATTTRGTTTPGKTTTAYTFCGDGTFNNNQSGLSALSCTNGGVVLATPVPGNATSSYEVPARPGTASPWATKTGPSGSAGLVFRLVSARAKKPVAKHKKPTTTTTTKKHKPTTTTKKHKPGSGSGSGTAPTTTTTMPQPITVQLNSSNVHVIGRRNVTVLGASSAP